MFEIEKILDSAGFDAHYEIEEDDFINAYKGAMISGETNQKKLDELIIARLLSNIGGLNCINIPKHIPDYSRLDTMIQGQLIDLFDSVRFRYDLLVNDFYPDIVHSIDYEHLAATGEKAILILLENADGGLYTQYLFLNTEQQREQTELFIGKAIKKFAEKLGLFHQLKDIILKETKLLASLENTKHI